MQRTQPPTRLGLLALLTALGGCATVSQELPPPIALTPAPAPAPVLVPVPVPIGLTINFTTDRLTPVYPVGDTIQLQVSVNQDAQVVILNTDAQGNTTVLFPNAHAPDNHLRAGQVYSLPWPGAPFRYRIARPTGPNLLRVIATTGNQPFLALNYSNGPFASYNAPTDNLLRQVQVVTDNQPGAQWATLDYPFTVVR